MDQVMDQRVTDPIPRPKTLALNDDALFKKPELPPWRKRQISKTPKYYAVPKFLRISDPRKRFKRKRGVMFPYLNPMIDHSMDFEELFSKNRQNREKCSVNPQEDLESLHSDALQENTGRAQGSDQDFDAKKALEIVSAANEGRVPSTDSDDDDETDEEEDVDSEGEIDEELAALCRKMEEKRRARENGGSPIPIPPADRVLDLKNYHQPTLFLKSQRRPNVLPPDAHVIPIEPFMEEWELLSEGRGTINGALDLLHRELGVNIDNPTKAFNDHFFMVHKLKTTERGPLITRCHPRNTMLDPPIYGEILQETLKQVRGTRARHPRASMYPAHFSYDNVAYCEDPYWENHVGRRPPGVKLPLRPKDIWKRRLHGLPAPRLVNGFAPGGPCMLTTEGAELYKEMRDAYFADLAAHGGVNKEHAYE